VQCNSSPENPKEEGTQHKQEQNPQSVENAGLYKRRESQKEVEKVWTRYERMLSMSLWHTDWFFNGKWIIAYLDASRLITGYGVFDKATTENAIKVLKEAME